MEAAEPHRVVLEDGTTLVIFDWPPASQPSRATLLFAHATGFHARCWDQVIAELPDCRSLALDQRGHGRSTGGMPVRWHQFGRDLATVVRDLDLQDVTGIGHSMGGHAMTEAAALEPSRFRRLILIDPVIGSPGWYAGARRERFPGEHPVARRRAHWSSAAAMIERLRDRSPFDTWDERVLHDYCTHGLLPDPSGHGYVLGCHPQVEAEVYMTSAGNRDIYERVRSLQIPVLVIRARQAGPGESIVDFRVSPTWPELASQFADGRDLYLPEQSHFLPMEHPTKVAQIIRHELVS